ncbi:MAG: FGGY-family carbohydrate kinase [Clostridia bacterium]|nr:FGGY-family carbohydrate kinase [Clostridia bacterium]
MIKEKIEAGKTYLGIELGSTRIKACLIDDTFSPIASGSFEWESHIEDGYWTYSLDEIHNGVRGCFKSLCDDVMNKYQITLTTVGAIGVSAMMHGYLAFDEEDNLLVPFRTWRNTTTGTAAAELTQLFKFSIPQRWSIAHLYQAILNGEEHVKKIAHITTLAGYIHYLLTGKREVGIGEASGMFPISGSGYDRNMLEKFSDAVKDKYEWNICDILPCVKRAGERGAYLTEEGARFLDADNNLKAGIPVCPPEGDAGTGMAATNAVSPKTGNVSAGTSIFAMLVLEKQLSNIYPEIDMVTTPDGFPVAMVHCNNCCSELDAWVKIFGEFASLAGMLIDKSKLYEMLYKNALGGDEDCGGIISYNYLSGEHVTGIEHGRPMYFRTPQSKMSLANFMKSQLYSSMASLKIGMDILFKQENVSAEQFMAHGGLFKVPGAAQQILANALDTSIAVMETAGEGGAWGMALLAAYMLEGSEKTLGAWLDENVFADMDKQVKTPDKNGVAGFCEYINVYRKGLEAEKKLEGIM